MPETPTFSCLPSRAAVLGATHGQSAVLLADPDLQLLRVLRLALPRFGITVETSDSATDTVNRVVRRRRHVLVIDDSFVTGPTASDTDVLRARVDRLVVLVSDWDRCPQIRAAIGADSCLRKPFAIESLLNELQFTPSTR